MFRVRWYSEYKDDFEYSDSAAAKVAKKLYAELKRRRLVLSSTTDDHWHCYMPLPPKQRKSRQTFNRL